MDITGPAKGHSLMKTKEDKDGIYAKGTWNNCGSGRTLGEPILLVKKILITTFLLLIKTLSQLMNFTDMELELEIGLNWAKADSRFDLSKEVNEPNKVGYVVEIDPLNPNSTQKTHSFRKV